MVYADSDLITTTPTELQELLNKIRIAGKKYGIVIDKGKAKVMATEGDKTVKTVGLDGDIHYKHTSIVHCMYTIPQRLWGVI